MHIVYNNLRTNRCVIKKTGDLSIKDIWHIKDDEKLVFVEYSMILVKWKLSPDKSIISNLPYLDELSFLVMEYALLKDRLFFNT